MAVAVVSGAVGAFASGVVGLVSWGLSRWFSRRRSVQAARITLAREIIRYRGDQTAWLGR